MKSAFLCVFVALLFAGLAMADWDFIYEFNQLPEDAKEPEWETAWDTNEPNGTQGSIIADPDNPGNNIYYINDVAGQKTGRNVPLNIVLSVGLTIVVRMKCTSGGHDQSFNIGWYDEAYSPHVECVLWPDHFQYGTGDHIIIEEFEIDGSEWHIYRITVEEKDATVYVDEGTKPKIDSKTVIGVTAPPTASPGVLIGSHSTAGVQEIYYDYLLVDLSGAYAPGEGPPIPSTLIGGSAVEATGKLSTTWGLLKTR